MEPIYSAGGVNSAVIKDGTLYVYQCAARMVALVKSENGTVQSQEVPYTELLNCPDPDLFNAYYDAANTRWMVDVDCGAQRWFGPLSSREFYAGLRKSGFSKTQIADLVKQLR